MLHQAKSYLARVIPLPGPGDPPAYVNIHTLRPDPASPPGQPAPKKKGGMPGRAFTNLDAAIEFAEWQRKDSNVFVCMSTQRLCEPATDSRGVPFNRAIRNQGNAVCLKALFLDLDVKPEYYPTQGEALQGLSAFIAAAGLPPPSLLVASGTGGFHVYWTLDRALMRDEWQVLADAFVAAMVKHGLKNDSGISADSSRVLRLPETWNHKTNPPNPTRLVRDLGIDYPVADIEKILAPYTVPRLKPGASPLPPKPPLNFNELGEGLEDIRKAAPLVDLDDVVHECGFVRDTLTTGGESNGNPLWNLTTLLSVFTAGGRDDAHRLGNKHPTYDQSATDALYDRKTRERDSKGLGWPLCTTFHANGSKNCGACPHFRKGKSPLHFARKGPAAPVNDLPKGYVRDADGIISKLVMGENGPDARPICSQPFVRPWLQTDPWALHFESNGVGKDKAKYAIEFEAMASASTLRTALHSAGLLIQTWEQKPLQEFFVSWTTELKKNRANIMAGVPYGWVDTNSKTEGFAYGGQVWTPGQPRDAAPPDPMVAKNYEPTGSVQPFYDALKIVLDQKRPALDVLVAASFAAPLMMFTGQAGALLSAYSIGTGFGKSTAVKVGQAVWGHTVKGVEGLKDTENSLMKKAGQLRSLPIYWDEIKTKEAMQDFSSAAFQMSAGREKHRMHRNGGFQDSGDWKTLLISSSNASVLDHIAQRTKGTPAGIMRCFEFEVPRHNGLGQLSGAHVDRKMLDLERNYGHVGLEYAKWLGANFEQVDADMQALLGSLEVELNKQQEERFWFAIIGTIILGARYASQLGFVPFDELELKKFLVTALGNMRTRGRAEAVDLQQGIEVATILSAFLADMKPRNMILTDRIHQGRGRPPRGSVIVHNNFDKGLSPLRVQKGDDGFMRISQTAITDWLIANKQPRAEVIRQLESQFGMRRLQGVLGSGTDHATGLTEWLYEITWRGDKYLDDSVI